MPPLKPYSSDLTYSYAPGVFPSLQLMQNCPERAQRLLLSEKAQGEGNAVTPMPLTDEEAELARVLSLFPERVSAAIAEYEPSLITRYILDLAAAFNRFYHECQIITAPDAAQRENRIAFTRAANTVLHTALGLICMPTPEKI